ncbi:RcnB family protein [Croceicoccus gelatinilyticus]|uniref:RcnB family protein n=1 Tax=Croceicoccus gelatinilyticus TaxID=2835536 RepID=UPI001BCDB62E|nr:RcnB family protein [Croceicoccus gelatinilyticus]MBS7670301.1 RcnB family protein [Croceicoccus gelatinilyticus]
MKTVTAAAIAIALAIPGAPALAKQPDNHGAAVSHVAKSNAGQHKFAKGEKFDRSKASNYRVIDARSNKRLSTPPSGYHWVRSGNDAVLVGITSGIVSSVVSSVF